MEMKARLITDDIDKIKLQQKDLSGVITMMETESNDSMHLAEKKKYLSYVIKSDALKRKSEQTKKELATLQKEIGELEMKKKKNGLIYIWWSMSLNHFSHHQCLFCSVCLLPHFLK